MLDMTNCTKRADDEVVFVDGFLYIILRNKELLPNEKGEIAMNTICRCLCPEYDKPWTLADIAREYPDVSKVIFDDALKGYVYNYDNHGNEQNAEKWELVGTTLGYA